VTPGLYEAAKRARAVADTSTDWRDHRVALALEAAAKVEENRALAHALTETGPTDDLPPWSQVSAPSMWPGRSLF
jgi:hypothetical protein